MLRHFYVTDDLDTISGLKRALTDKGINKKQLHVLSKSEAELSKRRLPAVESILQQDALRCAIIGAGIGTILATTLLIFTYQLQWYQSQVGWMPFIFLAIAAVGFLHGKAALLVCIVKTNY